MYLKLVVFLISFCSIGYQVVLSTQLTYHFGGGIFIYPISSALFILGLGLSAFIANKIELNKFKLVIVEVLLFLIGSLAIPMIILLNSYYSIDQLLLGFPLILLLGLLSGFELPIIINLNKYKEFQKILKWDYIGGLAFSIIFTFILHKNFDLYLIGLIFGMINLCILFIICFDLKFIIIPITGIILFFTLIEANLSSFLINKEYRITKYQKIIEIKRTLYQKIVLIAENKKRKSFEVLDVLNNPQDYYLKGFLNGNLQFYNDLKDKTDPYHYYLIEYLFQAFPKKIKKVLVLGGGDGLPARQLSYQKDIHIDMLDLDEEWVEFSRKNKYMKILNNNALNISNIQLYYNDAFQFVLSRNKKYDLIIVDFPESDNLAGVRVHSLQFKRDLYRLLTKDGIIIIQNDTTPYKTSIPVIMNTLIKAEFFPLYGEKLYSNRAQDYVTQFIGFKRKSDLIYYKKWFKENGHHLDYYPINYRKIKIKKNQHISYYDPKDIFILVKAWVGLEE